MATSPMATSPTSSTPWKLKESVKFMKISMSKGDNLSQNSTGRKGALMKIKQEIKKWKKVDIYLFEYDDVPVIKYCPTGSELSQCTSEVVQLNDVSLVKHMPNSSKPNVLTVIFSTYYLLLSFKSKSTMEQWMSELLCLTETFTFLLYETSNSSIKLGYYQLRFVLGNFTIVAYDVVTKKVEWSWHISHICGYSSEKSGIKVEVGKKSPVNGTFCFTGKQMEFFCEQIKIFGRNYAKKRSHSMPSALPGELVQKESTAFRKRSFAMQHLPKFNENHESDLNDDSLTNSVFSDHLSDSLSSPIDHSCAHTFPRSNIKLDMSDIGDSISSVESAFSNDHINNPLSPVDNPSSPIVNPSSTIVDPSPELLNSSSIANPSSSIDNPSSPVVNPSSIANPSSSIVNAPSQLVNPSSIANSSSPIDDSSSPVVTPSSISNPSSPNVSPSLLSLDAGTKPDEIQSSNVSLKQLDVPESNTNISSLPNTHSKSLDDLNLVQKSTDSPRLCVSSSDLDEVNDDSDDEDYVIPFLYNPDEDYYVIASLFPCTDQYLAVKSNPDVGGYAEVRDVTPQKLTLSSNTTCDDDFRTRSNSDAYDYVKDFVLPISPRLSPTNICVKHDALTRLNSDINDYEEINVNDYEEVKVQEGPSVPSSTTCVEDDYPVRTDSDYEEVKDYILQEV